MPMMFQTYLKNNPGLYAQTPKITVETQAALFDWFRFREVNDDDRFSIYYTRQLNLLAPRYNKLLDIESAKFDPLVNKYLERLQNTGTTGSIDRNKSAETTGTESRTGDGTDKTTRELSGTNSVNENTTGETSGTTGETLKENTTGTENGTTSGTDKGKTSGTETRKMTGTETEKTTGSNVSIGKNNPNSISYAGAVAGNIPALDWTYASTQAQADTKGGADKTTGRTAENTTTGTSENTTSGTTETTTTGEKHGTTDGTYSETDKGTRTATGTAGENETTTRETGTTSARDTKTKETGTETEARKDTRIDKEIYTGRDGLTPQEAFTRARTFIINSSAFEWLRQNLEVCFLGIYEV